MKFQDFAPLSSVKRTGDGYIVASVQAARTGVQQYQGWELGRPDLKVANVYRPRDSVFARDSLDTFPNIPLTLDHPDQPVTADNYEEENVGNVFEVVPDGEVIRASIQIMAKRAVDAVNDGKRQLSVGYDAELEWTDGVAPDGTPYQAVQRNIRANHLAIVDRARAGPDFKIGDDGGKDRNLWGAAPITPPSKQKDADMSDTLKTVVLGDKAVQVADKDAPLIEQFKADADRRLSDAKAAHETALADKDKELAKKDAEIDDLKGKILSDADLDKRVAARAALIDKAGKIAKDVKTDGLSDADIRKAVVTAVRGEDAVKDKSDAYIDAAFDLLVEDAGNDPLRDTLKGGVKTNDSDAWGDNVFAMADVKMKEAK